MDLRTPIGIFFAVMGGLLLTIPFARGQIDAGAINLWSGIAMLAFGSLMLVLARRSGR